MVRWTILMALVSRIELDSIVRNQIKELRKNIESAKNNDEEKI